MTTKLDDVARGLIVDALISYVAIMREKNHRGFYAVAAWGDACRDMFDKIAAFSVHADAEDAPAALLALDRDDVDALIEERRALLQEQMGDELSEIEEGKENGEDSGPPPTTPQNV